MKVSLSWLQEYISGESLDVNDVNQAFIHLGFEVEDLTQVGDGLTGPIKIGKVLDIEELTGFKKPIRYCQVQVGASETDVNGIVCGASNFSPGDYVVVALPGSELPGGFQISQRETYGKISKGMICSLRELGIGEDHSGILVLDQNFNLGDDAVEVLHLKDYVFDLSILPDRGYALSVRGLARELAMYFNREYIDPMSTVQQNDVPKSEEIYGKILAETDCSALVLTEISGIDSATKTPWFMKQRIVLAGMRPVSFPVDVTNYVMLEVGQPLHAFDRSKIRNGIIIRFASTGERLETLDHITRELDSNDLVVADEGSALSLAGIMGGVDSEIGQTSSSIMLEAAHFAADRISESARRHVLSSEASRRFERGVDPHLPRLSSDMACHLFVKYGNAKIISRTNIENPHAYREVTFDLEKFKNIAGYEIPLNQILSTLESIGCKVIDQQSFRFEIPSWRPDLTDTNDLAEEVLRITGYDQVPMLLPAAKSGVGLSGGQRLLQLFRTFLAARGLSEILNYPFVSGDESNLFSESDDASLVRIANPLSEEEPYLRDSLLPGLLRAAQRNIGRGATGVAAFEIGSVFENQITNSPDIEFPLTKQDVIQIDRSIPKQEMWLGILLTGIKNSQSPLIEQQSWDWNDAIQGISDLLAQFNIRFAVTATKEKGFHPGRCAQILVDGKKIGVAGELHPNLAQRFGLNSRASAVHLNLSEVLKNPTPNVNARPLVNFPIAKEDLAVVLSREIPALDVLATVKQLDLPELEQVELFDVYQGDQLNSTEKSLTLALRFRAADRTLTSLEISALKEQVLLALERHHQARIRD